MKNEVKTFDNNPQNVFIGGFSQGSAVAMNVISKLDIKLGGVAVIGSFVFESTKFTENQELPDLLVIHGALDETITLKTCESSYGSLLKKEGTSFVVLEDMKHDLYSEKAKEIIFNFLRKRASADS